jgi:O-antigen ligase
VLSLAAGFAYGGYSQGKSLDVDWRLVPFALAAIVLNASTTGFFAVFVVLGSFLVVGLLRNNSRVHAESNLRTVVQLLVGLVATAVVALLMAQAFGLSLLDIILSEHVAKITEGAGSGAFRFTAILYTMQEVFVESPILGVGYGSHRSLSLVAFLLANTGIVGFATFLLFNGAAFFHAVKAMNRTADPELAAIAFTVAVTHLSLLGVLFVKGDVSLTFGWLWMMAALGEACYQLHRRRQRLASAGS